MNKLTEWNPCPDCGEPRKDGCKCKHCGWHWELEPQNKGKKNGENI